MPPDHDTILRDWNENAARDEDVTFRFLRSLKMVPNPDRIDALARDLHAQAFGRIDCTRCANCCKTMPPAVSAEDIHRISARLGMSEEAFIAGYLVVDEDEGGYRMKTAPCPFLGRDDRCTIYEVRPEVCREFPHTDKEGFIWRIYLHAANARACPAVYYIVKQMRHRSRRP
jgi:Fe-S-cluster containining protein